MAIYSPGIELSLQPSLQDHELAAAAVDVYGSNITAEPLAGGSNPDVFSVTGKLGRGVMKFYPVGSAQPAFERFAMHQAIEAGVPVPEVHRIGEIETEDGIRPWLAMGYAEGRQMSEIPLSSSEEALILGGVGRLLADLHHPSRPTQNGYWRQIGTEGDQPKWSFDSWADYLGNMAETLANDRPHLVEAGLSDKEIAAILHSLGEYREMTPARSVFTHADLRKPHVYVDGDLNITSVIDWGSGQANSPEREFSKPFSSNDEPMIAAYADASGYPRTELDERIRRMQIAHIPALVIFNTKRGKVEEARERVQHVQRLLAA